MSEYESVGGGLKLKGLSGINSRKKKKKSKKKIKEVEVSEDTEKHVSKSSKSSKSPVDTRTASEKAFAKVQAQRELDRIKKAAAKSHRERVQEVNEKLDKLSEHYDIPKVSWTK